MRLTCDQPGKIGLSATMDSLLHATAAGSRPDELVLSGKAPSHVDPNYLRDAPNPVVEDRRIGHGMLFEARLRVLHEGDPDTGEEARAWQPDEARRRASMASPSCSRKFEDRVIGNDQATYAKEIVQPKKARNGSASTSTTLTGSSITRSTARLMFRSSRFCASDNSLRIPCLC